MRSTNRPLVNSPAPDAINGTPSFQLGVSLIELMISITIGLLILVALSTLFVNQSRARIELDKSNRMIDNGSYALKLLSDNLSMAGYYGEFIPTSGVPALPAALPDPCSTDPVVMAGALQLAVQGYDAATPTGSISSLPPLCGLTYTAGSALTLKPGSESSNGSWVSCGPIDNNEGKPSTPQKKPAWPGGDEKIRLEPTAGVAGGIAIAQSVRGDTTANLERVMSELPSPE